MIPLTPKQNELLDYLKSCEICPSFTEMRVALGLKSKSGVHRLIESLEERGFVRRMANRARSIELCERTQMFDLSQVPLTTLTGEVNRRVRDLIDYLNDQGGRA